MSIKSLICRPGYFAAALLLLWVIWTAGVCFAPESAFVHDSPEFVVTALFQDIAHPAGSPTYSQLSNFFSLIPLGPVAFRVHLFALTCGLGSLVLCAYISFLLLKEIGVSSHASRYICLIAPLLACGSPSFVKQLFSAEVYGLGACFALGLIVCGIQFVHKGDRRFALTGALLGGIGLGNHPALIVLVIASFIICLALEPRVLRIQLAALLIVFGVLGGSIYSFLPARTAGNWVLGTGEPRTVERFIKHVSNARDRELRASTTKPSDNNTEVSFVRVLKLSASEIGAYVLLLSFIGSIALFKFNKAILALILISISGTLYLFLNWQPDPWASAILCFAILASLGIGQLFRWRRRAVAWGLGVVVCVCVLRFPLDVVLGLRNSRIAATVAELQLQSLPAGAIFIAESSWFPLVYAHYAEGLRPDVALVYQPRLLFPDYFESFMLRSASDSYLSNSHKRARSGDPDLDNLSSFLRFSAPYSPIYVESNVAVNKFLLPVFQSNEAGQLFIENGVQGALTSNFLATAYVRYADLLNLLKNENPNLVPDIKTALEAQVINDADLALLYLPFTEVLDWYRKICKLVPSPCGRISYINIAKLEAATTPGAPDAPIPQGAQ